jgi:N4-gp56 family major capsid protein
MAGSTSATLNDLLPQIVAEAQFVASERSIMRGLVRNYSIPAGSGKSIVVPVYPRQTAAAVTEGNEVDNTAVSTTGTTITVSTVALRTLVTDLARTSAASNVVADVGRLFGEAIARKIDADLMAKFSDFSTNTVGSTTTTISAGTIFQAVSKLKAAGYDTMDMACVLHPAIAYDLKANLTNTFANPNAGDLQNEAMRSGFVGMLAGVAVYESGNLDNNGTAGDFVGGLFHRDALGLAIAADINIETQRRASYLGDDIVASAYYGVGTIQEAAGVAVSADSTIL